MDSAKRPDIYSVKSERTGLAGLAENILRQFKNLIHLALMLPIYALACAAVGVATMPGLYFFREVFHATHGISLFYRVWILGAAAAVSYLMYGFSIIFVMPALNFLLRTKLSDWRGPYYSLPAIRWYIHNGAAYVVRYTFLEFITPSPFNLLFYPQ
jgi:hypothetical protein